MYLEVLEQINTGKRYKMETATVVAHDVWWDERNMERYGRNTWLLQSPKSQFFVLHQTL